MNKITATPNVTELTAVRQLNSKPASGDGEFKEMLSGALKTSKQTATATPSVKTGEAAPPEKAAAKTGESEKQNPVADTKPVKPQTKPAKATPSEIPDEAQSAEAAAVVASTNMAAQVSNQNTGETGATESQEQINIQQVAASPILLQPADIPQTDTTQSVQTHVPESAEQAAGSIPAEVLPAETQTKITQPVTAEPAEAQRAQPEARPKPNIQPAQRQPVQQAPQEQPIRKHQPVEQRQETPQVQASQQQPQTQTVQASGINPIPQEIQAEAATEPVSDETVMQITGTVASRVYPGIKHTVHPEVKQNKFDEMVAKAAQELGQGKTASTEQVTEPEIEMPVVSAETVEAPDVTDTPDVPDLPDEVEAPAIPDENSAEPAAESEEPVQAAPAPPTEAKSEPRTTVTASNPAPRFEQRPLKEIPKADEAILQMVQSKPHEVHTPEVIRSEPQTFAHPVEVPPQADQIRAQVIESLEKEKMEFNLQLRPQELGKIDVRMVLEGGKLSVEIMAASQKSTELLTKQAEGLIASLKMNNIEVSSVTVVQAAQNTTANMDGQYNLNNFQNQTGTNEQSGAGGNGRGQGENQKNPDARPDEASETPQRLLNYSV